MAAEPVTTTPEQYGGSEHVMSWQLQESTVTYDYAPRGAITMVNQPM